VSVSQQNCRVGIIGARKKNPSASLEWNASAESSAPVSDVLRRQGGAHIWEGREEMEFEDGVSDDEEDGHEPDLVGMGSRF